MYVGSLCLPPGASGSRSTDRDSIRQPGKERRRESLSQVRVGSPCLAVLSLTTQSCCNKHQHIPSWNRGNKNREPNRMNQGSSVLKACEFNSPLSLPAVVVASPFRFRWLLQIRADELYYNHPRKDHRRDTSANGGLLLKSFQPTKNRKRIHRARSFVQTDVLYRGGVTNMRKRLLH